MTKFQLLAGVAGLSVVLYGWGAAAQDTGQGAAPSQGCSGLGCLFGGQPQPQQAPPPADAPQAGSDPAPGAVDDGTQEPKKAKPIAKPVHVVTIAAEPVEAARLKRLASALPNARIKIVKMQDEAQRARSDFTVSTSLADSGTPSDGAGTKLFTEQMHVVAGGAIHSISDLRGKVVSFGPDGSPSQIAARKAFAAVGVKVNETPLDLDNALDGLSTGDLDAVVMLAPEPVDRLREVSVPGLHLVSWPDGGALPDGATPASIESEAYPRLLKPGETIRAVGVDATLTMSERGARQSTTKAFLKALAQHSDALTKRGFDLLKADLENRNGRRVASVERDR